VACIHESELTGHQSEINLERRRLVGANLRPRHSEIEYGGARLH
jgi:hypothetical protein